MREIMPIISDVALTILAAYLCQLAIYAVIWIRAATTRARSESVRVEDAQLRDFVNEAFARADDLATKTVARIEQTTAQHIRESIKSGVGSFATSDLEQLGRDAVHEVINSLTPDYREAIQSTVGNLERYITSTVESKVFQLKNDSYITLGTPVGY